MSDEPHEPGWRAALKMAAQALRCRAKRRHDGQPCQGPAMRNGRCRLHGGKSTGPRTSEGLERSKKARLRHGYYASAAQQERAEARRLLRILRDLLDSVT
jgi:hypothetical protein